MLQTEKYESSAKSGKTKTMPLSGRLQMVETDVNTLKTRVAQLQGEVGMELVGQADFGGVAVLEEQPTVAKLPASTGSDEEWAEDLGLPPTAPASPPAANKRRNSATGHKGRRHGPAASLLEKQSGRGSGSLLDAAIAAASTTRDDTLKGKTAEMEAEVAALKSKVEGLETQVWPELRNDDDASLLSIEAHKAKKDVSLTARIISLEKELESLKTRTSNLEHVVMG